MSFNLQSEGDSFSDAAEKKRNQTKLHLTVLQQVEHKGVLCCVAIPTLTLMEQLANNHPRNKELLYTNVTSITLNSAQFSSIKYNFIDLQRLVPGRCDLGRCRVSPAIPEQFLQRDFLLPGSTVDMGGACQLASTCFPNITLHSNEIINVVHCSHFNVM